MPADSYVRAVQFNQEDITGTLYRTEGSGNPLPTGTFTDPVKVADWDTTAESDETADLGVRVGPSPMSQTWGYQTVTVDNTDPTVTLTAPAAGAYICKGVTVQPLVEVGGYKEG